MIEEDPDRVKTFDSSSSSSSGGGDGDGNNSGDSEAGQPTFWLWVATVCSGLLGVSATLWWQQGQRSTGSGDGKGEGEGAPADDVTVGTGSKAAKKRKRKKVAAAAAAAASAAAAAAAAAASANGDKHNSSGGNGSGADGSANDAPAVDAAAGAVAYPTRGADGTMTFAKLTVQSTVIGRGSHGTTVFEGTETTTPPEFSEILREIERILISHWHL